MKMLKNQKGSFYVAAFATLCALAGLILLNISNGTMGYPIQGCQIALLLSVCCLVAAVLSLLLQSKNANEVIVSFLRLVALGSIMGALAITVADRAVIAGGLFTWNSLDSFAWTAFYTGIACVVFQVLTALFMVISGCMKQGIKE